MIHVKRRYHMARKRNSGENGLVFPIKLLRQPSCDDPMMSKGTRSIPLAKLSSFRNRTNDLLIRVVSVDMSISVGACTNGKRALNLGKAIGYGSKVD